MANNFSIPNAFLSQLNEFSSGGYIILNFDETGNPRICCKFDDAAHSLAAKKYLEHWLDAVDEVQKDMMIDNIIESQIDGEDSGDYLEEED